MNRVTPIVLLALLALLGAYVVVFEVRPETRWKMDIEKQEKATRVFDVEPRASAADAVVRLEIARDNQTIAFEKVKPDVWRLTSPLTAPARSELITAIVREVLFLHKAGEPIEKQSFGSKGLETFGLAHPRMVVRLVSGAGPAAKEYVLNVGNADPTKGYVYVQRPDETSVSLVDKPIIDALAAPLSAFREPKFLRFDLGHVAALKLRTPLARMEVSRRNDAWVVTKPFVDRADSLRMEDVLRAVAGIAAKSFVAESVGRLEPLGLEPPRIEISFTRDDNTTSTVLIGNDANEPAGTVYAKLADESAIYTVDDSVVKKLDFQSDWLRERRIAMISTFGVKEIRVARKGGILDVAKEPRGWKILSPVTIDADESEVDSFVRSISALNVVRFPNDAPDDAALARYGLDEPSRTTLTLKLTDKPEQVFYFGKVDPKERDLYLQRKGSPIVYTVAGAFDDRLSSTYLDFRTRKVASMSKFGFTKLVLKRPQGELTLEKTVEGTWRITSPVNAPADEINVGSLCDDLNDLQAVMFMTEKAANLADFGLDKPTYEVVVEYRTGPGGQSATQTLLIGKQDKNVGWAAKLKDNDLVFAVSGSLVDRLNAELRKRLVWDFKPSDVSAVTWQASSGKITVRREAGDWIVTEPAGCTLIPGAVEQVIGPLQSLRADRFDSYTKTDLAKYGLDKPRLAITLTVGGKERTFYMGAQKDRDRAWVCVSNDEGIFTMNAAVVGQVMTFPVEKSGPPPMLAPK